MWKNSLAAVVIAGVLYGSACAQLNWLEQEAHRPYQVKPGTDSNLPTGYTPQQMLHAYGIDQIPNQGAGQIIGIVDAYDYPTVESDLQVFDNQFSLAPCTFANGCLAVVYSTGRRPPPNSTWTGETALDVQWA